MGETQYMQDAHGLIEAHQIAYGVCRTVWVSQEFDFSAGTPAQAEESIAWPAEPCEVMCAYIGWTERPSSGVAWTAGTVEIGVAKPTGTTDDNQLVTSTAIAIGHAALAKGFKQWLTLVSSRSARKLYRDRNNKTMPTITVTLAQAGSGGKGVIVVHTIPIGGLQTRIPEKWETTTSTSTSSSTSTTTTTTSGG